MKIKLRLLNKETKEGNKEDPYIFVKTDKQLVKLNTADILYIEAMQNYIVFHTDKEKVMALVPMKNIFELLSKEEFIQVHRSYDYILTILTIPTIPTILTIAPEEHTIPNPKTRYIQSRQRRKQRHKASLRNQNPPNNYQLNLICHILPDV